MNTLVKVLVLSISTALVAAPVMAAPQDHQPNKGQTQFQHNKAPAPQNHQAQMNKHSAQPLQQHKPAAQKAVKPSYDWRAGQKVPSQFRGQRYNVDHMKHRKLTKPAKNEQWIKVNNDYVLTNVISHIILKVIAG